MQYAHPQECKTVYYCIWFPALDVAGWSLGEPEPESGQFALCTVHCVHSTQCTLPASRLPRTAASNIKRWKPHAVINGLALLKMGIMMPETC
jgi:hypothetical protein